MGIFNDLLGLITDKLTGFLTKNREVQDTPLCDFSRLRFEIRPCDVILVEGRSRVSDVIRAITLSRWTHAGLFIGKINDIEDEETKRIVESYYPGDHNDQLVLESLMEAGAVVSPLTKYQYDNLRVCRPKELLLQDVQKVIGTAAKYLGSKYNTRQFLDLGRLIIPYGVLPGRWRSTLFEYNAGDVTHTICSTILVESFASNRFPVLPLIQRTEDGRYKWSRRNPKLFTPSDFDYSPYFDIIKYPFLGDEKTIYSRLPWDKRGVICNDVEECFSMDDLKDKEPEDRTKT